MRRFGVMARVAVAVGLAGLGAAHGQSSNSDPYATNPTPGQANLSQAAPAGKDSGEREKPPAGAVNQGPYDAKTWKYGPGYDVKGDVPIWNPVMIKMMK